MANFYSSLALSYREWYYRMTPRQWDSGNLTGWVPAANFAFLQGFNVCSLAILALPLNIPAWLFSSAPVVCGFCAYWVTNRIYRAHPSPRAYAKDLKAPVPSLREFPFLYLYLFGSLALLIGCVYVAMQHAP